MIVAALRIAAKVLSLGLVRVRRGGSSDPIITDALAGLITAGRSAAWSLGDAWVSEGLGRPATGTAPPDDEPTVERLAAAVATIVDGAEEDVEPRLRRLVEAEVVGAAQDAAATVAEAHGARAIRRANPGACPRCQALDGRPIGRRPDGTLKGVAIHPGCECTIEAAA